MSPYYCYGSSRKNLKLFSNLVCTMEGETDKKIEELQAQINMLMATKSPTSVWNSSKEQMKTQLRETFLW